MTTIDVWQFIIVVIALFFAIRARVVAKHSDHHYRITRLEEDLSEYNRMRYSDRAFNWDELSRCEKKVDLVLESLLLRFVDDGDDTRLEEIPNRSGESDD